MIACNLREVTQKVPFETPPAREVLLTSDDGVRVLDRAIQLPTPDEVAIVLRPVSERQWATND
jgi:hypothetical protein